MNWSSVSLNGAAEAVASLVAGISAGPEAMPEARVADATKRSGVTRERRLTPVSKTRGLRVRMDKTKPKDEPAGSTSAAMAAMGRGPLVGQPRKVTEDEGRVSNSLGMAGGSGNGS